MILGSIITGAVLKNRVINRMADLRTERGFIHRIERIIEPDESQKEIVHDILTRHFDKIHQFGENMRKNFESQGDSLFKELENVLRPEQLGRFKERMDRMRKFGKPPRSRRGHPPERRGKRGLQPDSLRIPPVRN